MKELHWEYFDKFSEVIDKYLPEMGEGDTMATQIVTAVNRIVYRFYNDGDYFTNQYFMRSYTDLTSYANWLECHIREAGMILSAMRYIVDEYEYEEEILMRLADKLLREDFLKAYSDKPKVGSIYDCRGVYEYIEDIDEEDEEDDYWEDDDDEEYF